MLSVKEIADVEVGYGQDHQVCVPEIRPSEAGSSGSRHRSFRLTEERFCNRSMELAGQWVISLSEGTESVGGFEPSEISRKGK